MAVAAVHRIGTVRRVPLALAVFNSGKRIWGSLPYDPAGSGAVNPAVDASCRLEDDIDVVARPERIP